jgi:hypothetical protein
MVLADGVDLRLARIEQHGIDRALRVGKFAERDLVDRVVHVKLARTTQRRGGR